MKLPYTGEVALDLPYAKPTGYGLGKSGWESLTPPEGGMPSLEQLKDWIDESYRAQAPKKRVKDLDSRPQCGGNWALKRSSPPPRSRTTAAAPGDRISAT
ncbi:MAG: hypothetical protein ACXW27_17125 [Allosphingosinicella sp.]